VIFTVQCLKHGHLKSRRPSMSAGKHSGLEDGMILPPLFPVSNDLSSGPTQARYFLFVYFGVDTLID